MLYAYCDDRGIAYRRCGKLIVATSEIENGKLASIKSHAEANGVDDMKTLSSAKPARSKRRLHRRAVVAFNRIIDSHAYMLALRGEIEDAGGALAFHAPFLRAKSIDGGFEIEVGGDAPMTIGCRLLVNIGRAVCAIHCEVD